MDYKKKKTEVSNIINLYFKGKKTLKELQDYSWKIIDEYYGNEQTNTPAGEAESIFWFAIWQIQHLASEDHKRDGTLERELKLTLEYLQNQKPIPSDIYGLPPSKKNSK